MDGLSREDCEIWSLGVAQEFHEQVPLRSKITVLAGSRYREFLVPMLEEAGHSVSVPMGRMRKGQQMTWLTEVLGKNHVEREAHPDLERFYFLLDALKERQGGLRTLQRGYAELDWPRRGMWFCFEPGEFRLGTLEMRVVHVGANGVADCEDRSLLRALEDARGSTAGKGDHRLSELRKHVGFALISREKIKDPPLSWGITRTRDRGQTSAEDPLEKLVSRHIRRMPLLCMKAGGIADDEFRRNLVRNCIGLLTSGGTPTDPPGLRWLGRSHPNRSIRESGLWHMEHNGGNYDPTFLDTLDSLINV
jgi:hypothetical protein